VIAAMFNHHLPLVTKLGIDFLVTRWNNRIWPGTQKEGAK
jgi:hypothetical protein